MWIQNEARISSKERCWSSLLQILALSTVLQKSIQTVYPDVPCYARPLLHGTVEPLEYTCTNTDVVPEISFSKHPIVIFLNT